MTLRTRDEALPEPAEIALGFEAVGLQKVFRGSWRIPIPTFANIASDTVGRHAAGQRANHLALVYEEDDGTLRRWTFAQLEREANAVACGLRRLGVKEGQPVGVHTGQTPETAIAHLALYKLGAIVVTLSRLYGPETLRHILRDSGLALVITDATSADVFRDLQNEVEQPLTVISTGPGLHSSILFAKLFDSPSPDFRPVNTGANTPALLMYTSGSTGKPKGLLHAHRILHAYLPTVRLFYNLEMDDQNCVFWTPADWAWVGGLLDLVLPAWYHGQTVVASRHRFEAQWAMAFMARHGVTHSFMTPTALKRLAEFPDPRSRWNLSLRVICTGGESLPSEIVRWSEEKLGAVCNEFYGLTEFNHLVGNCKRLYPIRAGSMGKAYPGHEVNLVDELGHELPSGEVGEIVATNEDPTLFLGYWGESGVPERLRVGANWLRTGDLAKRDENGYFWYQGRNDDLIKTAGYRIGPAEVEDALVRHPKVAEAAVIGSPDKERGTIVKAFVRLRDGVVVTESLIAELQEFVKKNLAAYKYPREIEFVADFPMTSSGKIRRGELRRRDAGAKAAAASRN